MTVKQRSVPYRQLGGIFDEEDVEAAMRVIRAAAGEDGHFFPLPEEADFQNALAAHEGAEYAVAVNACGTALDLCMMVLDIKPGDEVITTPLTFVCTATCATARGAKVIFADIDPRTMCLDPNAVRQKITDRTRAIIPVHFAGHAADVPGFDAITKDTGIPVIYDAAHAVGAKRAGRPIGGAGKASCYSFQSNKNITTLGEGGAVTTNDPDFAERVRQKKTFGYVYGRSIKVVTVGFNYRLTKPQLAVGITQLAKAARINAAKRRVMAQLNDSLRNVQEITLPAGIDADHAAHLCVVRVDTGKIGVSRDAFRAHLKDRYQVGTAVHYPAVWSWDAFREVEYDDSDCPIATKACEQVISLPAFPQMTDDDAQYVVWAVKQSISDLRA